MTDKKDPLGIHNLFNQIVNSYSFGDIHTLWLTDYYLTSPQARRELTDEYSFYSVSEDVKLKSVALIRAIVKYAVNPPTRSRELTYKRRYSTIELESDGSGYRKLPNDLLLNISREFKVGLSSKATYLNIHISDGIKSLKFTSRFPKSLYMTMENRALESKALVAMKLVRDDGFKSFDDALKFIEESS